MERGGVSETEFLRGTLGAIWPVSSCGGQGTAGAHFADRRKGGYAAIFTEQNAIVREIFIAITSQTKRRKKKIGEASLRRREPGSDGPGWHLRASGTLEVTRTALDQICRAFLSYPLLLPASSVFQDKTSTGRSDSLVNAAPYFVPFAPWPLLIAMSLGCISSCC